MANQILVDSNILIYSLNRSSPKNKIAKKFLSDNFKDIVIAHQNILETYRIVTHQKFPKTSRTQQQKKKYFRFFRSFDLISPNQFTFQILLELMKKYDIYSDNVFDAYLVSTAISNDIFDIATDNEKDFRKYAEIKILNPFK